MRKIRRVAVVLLTLVTSLVAVPVAFAHPLGNFTINHYAGLRVSRDKIAVDFVLDMAEIPAFQEIAKFDDNGNGQPDPQESAQYHPAQCEAIRPQLDLRLNGVPLTLHLDSSSIAFPPGAGGLWTLRLTCEFSTPIALPAQKARVDFADHSYAERIGWREIVVNADHVSLEGKFASTSISQRLTAYPKDMLTDPLNQRQISLGIDPTTASAATAPSVIAQPSVPTANRNNAFTQLITLQNLTPLTILLALLLSFVWGGMHALTPGHGKTIVGAYLVGSHGTVRHAFYLGLTTTITHTAGVIALGLITSIAARYIVPEQLFPWLSTISGLLVAGIGVKMFFDRLRKARLFPPVQSLSHAPSHNDGLHSHVQHQHRDDHFHEHAHEHHGPTHVHDEHQEHVHNHGDDEEQNHDHEHEHGLDGHTRTHLPPGAEGEPITFRSILALGISGGILPCPDALIVLLSAVALGRVVFGLVLVLAFSAGLAGVLSGIGILFVYAGRLFQLSPKQGWWLRLLPAASALVITLAGLGITLTALAQVGWLKL
jgi:ABC-type nickel/cobalt efflux system permease component RcnA